MPLSVSAASGCITNNSRFEAAFPNIEALYKIDVAIAVARAELGNTIISRREVLNERLKVRMTPSQVEIFNETLQLIAFVPEAVSPGELPQLNIGFSSQTSQETPIDHKKHLLNAKSMEEILNKSPRYTKLKQKISGLRTWWAGTKIKYANERDRCSKISIEIDQRLKEIFVLEKATGRGKTEAERTESAEVRVLIRRVGRMKTDLFNALENFTATRKYMSLVQTQFKALRDEMKEIEDLTQEPAPYDASERPKSFHYDYHLPEKRAVDTQWWIAKGFSWWADWAYSHLIQTSTHLEEAIRKCQSRQVNCKSEISRLTWQLKMFTQRRDEERKIVQDLDTRKHISKSARLGINYLEAKRILGAVNDQLAGIRGRLSTHEVSLAKLKFAELIHKFMLSIHTATRGILAHALADQRLKTGIYSELSLEYVHAIVCLTRKSMRAAVSIMTDVASDAFTMENLVYLEGVFHEQLDYKVDKEVRRNLRLLRNAGIVFATVKQRNDVLEDALDASLSEYQGILWLAKIAKGLRNDRNTSSDKASVHRQTSGILSTRKKCQGYISYR